MKGDVAQLSRTFGLSDVERLTNEAADTVAKNDWISRVQHAEKLQNFHKEIARNEVTQLIALNFGDDSGDSGLTRTAVTSQC